MQALGEKLVFVESVYEHYDPYIILVLPTSLSLMVFANYNGAAV